MTPRRRSPPYWTVPALALLLLLPGPWLAVVVAAIVAVGVTEHMLARRAARRLIAAAPASGLVLGRDRSGRAVALSDGQLSTHALILGASGAGKSTTLLRVLTEQAARGGAVVALDLKGSPAFARTLARASAATGRPFLLWTPDGPSHWNPLARGGPTELKDKLISTERFTEPHYQRAAERYLQTVLRVLEVAEPGTAPTLARVVDLSEPRRLGALLRAVPDPDRAHIQDYLGSLGPDQLSAVRGLATRLAIVTESRTGRYLAPVPGAPTIDLEGALRGEAVVLFSLNSSSYGMLAAQLGTLVVQELVAAAGARLADEERGPPALVAVDEFSALGADHLGALLARGREAGVSVLLATQELADLEHAGPGALERTLGNTTTKIIHRQDVPASAQMAARLAGTERVWEETRHFGGSWRAGLSPRGTRREVDRLLVAPTDVMSVPPGKALLITKTPRAEVRFVQVQPPAGPTSTRTPAAPVLRTPGHPRRRERRGPEL